MAKWEKAHPLLLRELLIKKRDFKALAELNRRERAKKMSKKK